MSGCQSTSPMNINLHIDCDPLWVYAGEYGLQPDYADARIYEESLPALLELLKARCLPATWFVIGRDLELPACRDFCRQAIDAGHQIANHTYSHLKDFHSVSSEVRRREIVECHQAILRHLHHTCRGIRLPGYYFDRSIVSVLTEMDYLYDSSVLPGPGVHLMSAAYLLLNSQERSKRFGRPWFLFSAASPYRLTHTAGGKTCWEVPLGTLPLLRLPIHSTFVFQWGMHYFKSAMALNRSLRPHMVYLFHGIDLLDDRGMGPLAKKVGSLRRNVAQRRDMITAILDAMARETVATTEESMARWQPMPRAV